MKPILPFFLLIFTLFAATPLAAQCISDDCGDIFADWAILNEGITVCEGVSFEVENQTLFPDIDFYVWDWGNGDRDTVYEVSNHFYTYEFSDDYACSADSDFIVYNISLEIYRTCAAGQSCHTQTAPVAVRLRPRANFASPEVVCVGDNTVMVNGTCGNGDYLWIFEDGSTSTETSPSRTFEQLGEERVILIVSNSCGGDTLVRNIDVVDKPIAVPGIDESGSTFSCGSTIVSFANNSQDADYYFWSFPSQSGYTFLEGTDDTSPNPVVEFSNSGTYQVYLTAGNNCRESRSQMTVEVVSSPEVSLQAIPAACDSTTVALLDYAEITGSYDSLSWTISGPDTMIVISDADNPLLSLSTPGSYTVQLDAISAVCPNAGASTPLQIQSQVDLALSAPAPQPLCAGSAPVTLSASITEGVWSGPGINPATSVFNPAAAGAGSHTLTYVAEGSACREQDSILLEVLASEQVVITSPVEACVDGTPLQLVASIPGGYWSGIGITDTAAGVFDPSVAGVGNTAITYTVNNEDNCALSDITLAEVLDLPALELPDTYQICSGQENVALPPLLNPLVEPAEGSLRWYGDGIVNAQTGLFDHQGSNGSYTVNVEYELYGCTTRETMTLVVSDPVAPTVSPDQVFCQSEAEVQLQASPSGGVWSGPGLLDASSGLISPSALTSGVHRYTYTTDAGSACAASVEVEIGVWGADAIEAGPQQTYCPNQATAQLPLGYPAGGSWSGPGITDPVAGTIDLSALDPDQQYTYEYALELGGSGCELSDQTQILLQAGPELDMTLPEVACLNAPVSLLVRPEPNVTYRWHFPDGTTYPGPAVQYAFGGEGQAEVSLVATMANGCVAEETAILSIATPPTAQIVPSTEQGCEPLAVHFLNNSQGDIDSYFWDFGNGNTSTAAVPSPQEFAAQAFTNTVYTVSLVARNACGEDRTSESIVVKPNELRAVFRANTTEGCVPLRVDFQDYSSPGSTVVWNFGDGYTGAGTAVDHTFTEAGDYRVRQIADNGCARDTAELLIAVLPEPAADFAHAAERCPDEPVEFTPTTDEFQTISWDFGDGNNSTAIQPRHEYAAAGTYTVTMTINSGSNACIATATSEVDILERPQISLTADGTIGCPPLEVCFTAESEEAQYFEWDFGEGNGSNGLNPCHTFTASGSYPVSLRGIDTRGCSSALTSLDVLVYEPPTAGIQLPQEIVCGYPQDVQFTSSSVDAVAHHWTFSNEIESQLSSPQVTFTEPGSYVVNLQVENTFGCRDNVQRQLEIKPRPLADFSAFHEGECVPQDVLFDNFSTHADSYLWLFGNGEQSTKSRPVQLFEQAGEYDITLIAGHDDICFDTLTLRREVTLMASPIAAFSWESPSADYEGLVQFQNESINAASYFWDFGDGSTSTAVDPLHDYRMNGSWLASLLATAANGCTDTALVELQPEVIYGLHFPNAFSPETGQGEVRVFKPAGLGLESWTLEIFSPWGERVLSSQELLGDQPGVAWDGQYKGRILPQGAYAYKASVRFLNGVRKIYTGSVTLLR